MKTTMRVLTAGLTEIEVVSSESPPEPPAGVRNGPVKLGPPLLYLAAGAILTLSITVARCDHRETNTYVHAESGSVVQVVNGEPAPSQGGR